MSAYHAYAKLLEQAAEVVDGTERRRSDMLREILVRHAVEAEAGHCGAAARADKNVRVTAWGLGSAVWLLVGVLAGAANGIILGQVAVWLSLRARRTRLQPGRAPAVQAQLAGLAMCVASIALRDMFRGGTSATVVAAALLLVGNVVVLGLFAFARALRDEST